MVQLQFETNISNNISNHILNNNICELNNKIKQCYNNFTSTKINMITTCKGLIDE